MSLPPFERRAWLLFGLVAASMGGCTGPTTVRITPVDQELNHRFLTGEGLDARLFSLREPVQYYEVEHLDALPPAAGRAALDDFIRSQYTARDLAPLRQLTVLFYRPTMFVDYRSEAYESARDTENGFMDERRRKLAALVRLEKIPGPGQYWKRQRLSYDEQTTLSAATDTVSLGRLLRR